MHLVRAMDLLPTSSFDLNRAPARCPAPDLAAIHGGAFLRFGQVGASVGQIQQLLVTLSYLQMMSVVYGEYCAATRDAVSRFQQDHGFAPTPETPAGVMDARTLRALEAAGRNPPRQPARSDSREVTRYTAPATRPPIAKKEELADLRLRLSENEAKATRESIEKTPFYAPSPKEEKARLNALESKYLPEARAAQQDYQMAKRLGASEEELQSRLDRYLEASTKASQFSSESLGKEREQLAGIDKNLGRAIDTSRVVRDVSFGTAAALASGGTSLGVTAAVVGGGAVAKTVSDEAASRVEGKASSAAQIAGQLAKNTAGLTVDAAGGAAFKGVAAAAHVGRISTAAAAAGFGATSTAAGAAKRAIAGEDALDGKAMLVDAVGGAVTGGAAQKLAPALASRGVATRVTVNAGVGAASAAGAQVATNAVTGRELTEGVGTAAIAGAGSGAVGGAVTGPRPPAGATPRSARAAGSGTKVEPPVLEAEPPVLPRNTRAARVEPPVLEAEPPVLPRNTRAARAEPPKERGTTPPKVEQARRPGLFGKIDSALKDVNERLTGQRTGLPTSWGEAAKRVADPMGIFSGKAAPPPQSQAPRSARAVDPDVIEVEATVVEPGRSAQRTRSTPDVIEAEVVVEPAATRPMRRDHRGPIVDAVIVEPPAAGAARAAPPARPLLLMPPAIRA